MPTMKEICTEWKGIRSALGNLICYIDGKAEQYGEAEQTWQKGYDCGWKDGMKAGVDSVKTDERVLMKARWSQVQVDFSNDPDLQIACMFCDNCHRWHTEVYHYGNPIEFANYCPHCGASMKEETSDDL